MKKILVFGITENPGGVESVIMNYYRSMDKEKVQFDFLCNTIQVAYEDEIKELGGNIYRVTARSKNSSKYKLEMDAFFKEHAKEYSAIWVNVCSLANIDYLKYAQKYGIKYRIIHSHNSQNMDSKARVILHRLNKMVVGRYATDFWSCSEEAGKWFYNNNILTGDRYLLVNNAIDASKYRYNENIRKKYRSDLGLEKNLVIANIGRLHFQKNQKFVLEVFNEIIKKNNNARLIFVGQGEDYDMLNSIVIANGMENYIQFLGVRDDIENIVQAADMLLFPSKFEGLPLTLIEAQASDLLIYASKDVIPEKVKMNSRLKFIELEKSSEAWADIMLSDVDKIKDRKSDISGIKEAGYDIESETRKLQEYFERE